VSCGSERHHLGERASFVFVISYSLTVNAGIFAPRNVAMFVYIVTVVEGATNSRHPSNLH
jgi:hypothetical protein